jgi:dTDP-4-amino-4,6-dideoxygalactose transaminase
MEGYNGRLDAIQAGFLQVKLKRLHAWNEQRRKHANRYTALLQGLDGVMTPVEPGWCRGVYHLYVIRTRERDALQKYLLDRNIVTGLHYPIPLHLQKAYAGYDFAEGDYPESEVASREILSLPMFPGLTEEQQDQVVNAIRSFSRFRRVDSSGELQGEAVSQALSCDPAGMVPRSADWPGKGIVS